MMNSKFLILLCALIMGGSFFLLRDKFIERDESQNLKGRLLAPDFKAEEIHHIHIQTQYGTLNLRKAAKHWVIQERDDYPASSMSIADLLNQLGSLKIMDSVDISSEDKLSEFYLKDPALHADKETGVRLRLSGKNGYQLDLFLGHILDSGSEASMHFGINFDGHRYARFPGENTVILINGSLDRVTTLLNLWIDDRFLKNMPILSIEYFEGSNAQWKISRAYAEDSFTCIHQGKTKKLPNLTAMIKTLMYTMQLDDILPPKSEPDLLNGFDHSFEMTTQEGIRYRIHLGHLAPIPEEERVYIGQATGMLVPVLFDSRRLLLLEDLPGNPGATSLQNKTGTPYFKRTYLVNHPEFGRLFLNLDELVLSEQLLKE